MPEPPAKTLALLMIVQLGARSADHRAFCPHRWPVNEQKEEEDVYALWLR